MVLIISILVSAGSMSITQSIQSQRLSSSATRLAGNLSAAAIQSVRENRTLEVHFLSLPSVFKNDKNDLQVRAAQLFSIDPVTGKTAPIRELWQFDTGIIMLAGAPNIFSNVLSQSTVSGFSGGYSFRPNGSTDLGKAAADRWCLTLINERDLAKYKGNLPPDYRTLVINASTGEVRVY